MAPTQISFARRALSIAAVLLPLLSALQGQQAAQASLPKPKSEMLSQALEAYRTGKFDAAVENYQAVLQQDVKSAEAYAGLARTYLKQEKIQTALETADKGVTEIPDSIAAHVALGEVYFRQGKMTECEKELLKGVSTPHPDARAYLGLVRLYRAYSLYARAKGMLEKAHALDPSDPEIQRSWMQTLSRSERIKSLESYLATATNDDQETRDALQRYLALLREREKQPRRSCRLVSKVTATEAPLKPMMIDARRLHGYGLEVKVNDRSSRLLLDTGASGLLINKKMAGKAGIEPLVESKIGGIGDKGLAGGYIGYANSIKVGSLEFQDCLVDVSDKRSVLDDDGLIGADVFDQFLITIDFPNEKLKLQELPKRPNERDKPATLATGEDDDDAETASSQEDDKEKTSQASKEAKATIRPEPQDRYIAPEMQSYTKIFRFGHELLIPTRIGDSEPKLFLIDTGAFTNHISPAAAREVTKVHSDPYMHVRGLNGAVKEVYSADKVILQFSRFRQENQDIVTFDLSRISKHAGTEISGTLGFAMLRMMALKIDYRDGLVDFEYDPKRWR